LLVEPVDRLFGDVALEELNEGKPARATGVAIDRNDDVGGIADGREVRPQIRFCCPIRHVAYEQTYSH
jgi:hypothetical protein